MKYKVRVSILMVRNFFVKKEYVGSSPIWPVYKRKKSIKKNLFIGKVAIGKARYLLNIVLCTWMFESSLFRVF